MVSDVVKTFSDPHHPPLIVADRINVNFIKIPRVGPCVFLGLTARGLECQGHHFF